VTKLIYRPLNKNGSSLAKIFFYNDYLTSVANFGLARTAQYRFDHLVAPTAFYHPAREFETWWRDLGIATYQLAGTIKTVAGKRSSD
jgi:hypothetical protein